MPKFLEDKLKKETRTCGICHNELPISSFYLRTYASGNTNFRAECINCNNTLARLWRAENPDKSRKATMNWRNSHPEKVKELERRHNYQRSYGITIADFETMLASQNNRCANQGCNIEMTIGRLGNSAHLDHDHKTGKIRAILCSNCNTSFGKLKENPEIIKGLLDYYNKHNA